MPILKATVTFPFFTNLPTDVFTNTFHFISDGVITYQEAANYLTERLASFYEGVYASAALAPYVVDANATVDWYLVEDTPPRVPYTLPLGATITNATSSYVPTEVACVLSYHGEPVSGLPMARRRGRIYLGGLANAAISATSGSNFPMFNQTFIDQVIAAAETYLLDTQDEGLQWLVYSPTNTTGTPVVGGWVDNAPDTQRRRSVLPTSRTVWP